MKMNFLVSLILVVFSMLLLNKNVSECFIYNNYDSLAVYYNFYSRETPNGLMKLSLANLTEARFNNSRNTVFVVHGFNSNPETKNFLRLKEELLKKENVNLFIVDWRNEAYGIDYFKAVYNVRLVAKHIAKFMNDAYIMPKRVHCIGHSLGAHVCGYVGKQMKLARITGLDPAGPLFGQRATERLDKGDAEFVDVIHTDSTLGFNSPLGHVDFYPNGGGSQPNCNDKKDVSEEQSSLDQNRAKFVNVGLMTCSHSRSIELYFASINSNCELKARMCNSYADFLSGRCQCNLPIEQDCFMSMGYNAKLNDQGTNGGRYYLKTSGTESFCLQ